MNNLKLICFSIFLSCSNNNNNNNKTQLFEGINKEGSKISVKIKKHSFGDSVTFISYFNYNKIKIKYVASLNTNMKDTGFSINENDIDYYINKSNIRINDSSLFKNFVYEVPSISYERINNDTMTIYIAPSISFNSYRVFLIKTR